MFESQYRHTLLAENSISLSESPEILLRSGFLASVKSSFISMSQSIRSHTASDIRISSFQQYSAKLRAFAEKDTCLGCLRRKPQYKLTCNHLICETCLAIFGERGGQVIRLRSCFVCQEKMPTPLSFRIHPPTAGAAVLSIDGGGARGIIPLKFLKTLEEEINLPIPVQRFFKVAFGISAGKHLV